MPQTSLAELLEALGSTDPQGAWSIFLNEYGTLIYQVVRHYENSLDQASDCFQFVCEKLIEDRSRRLRKFKIAGAATFSTWLRAVVRNLCIDWHRKEFGRKRQLRSISGLSNFDQEVFRLIYESGIPSDTALSMLDSTFPNVTQTGVTQSRQRIEQVLTANDRLQLAQRSTQTNHQEADEDWIQQLQDDKPNPELQAALNERKERLGRALAGLSPQDRLLGRLRFEEELTLEQVAKLLGLGNAQRTDRHLKENLSRLRKLID